ncbi:MAG: TonB-dependent siderophore receptor [Gammaproteobacteria bacterium]
MFHSRVTRWAIAGAAALALFGPVAAIAQADSRAGSAVATQADVRVFDIPALPLATAAIRFSEQAGVQLVFDAPIAKGVVAKAVNGRMSIKDALTRMLAATGVTWRYLNNGTITLERAPDSAGTRVLGPVRVQGTAAEGGGTAGINGSSDATATEGTGSYTSGALSIGSKTAQSMKDTPQSVSVITAQRMADQNINSFAEAMSYATGITRTGGQTSLDSGFISRGFGLTSIQIDGGAPLSTSYRYYAQLDMSQYDHVELLRGAAGQFNGYGDPSGTVNLVRKRPLDHRQVTLETEAGSSDTYRTVLDATSPLALDGQLRGRVVFTHQENKYFYDVAGDKKTLLYGILEYDLTPSTVMRGGISYARQNSVPWYNGLPRYENGDDLHLPRSTCLCFPWNHWDFDTREFFVQADQKLGDRWTLKLNVTNNRQDTTRKLVGTSGAVNPITGLGPTLTGNGSELNSKQLVAEATLAGSFDVLGQRQEVLLGVNRSHADGGDTVGHGNPISSTYTPYPGGPVGIPQINVLSFDPRSPLYSEPPTLLPSQGDVENGAVDSVGYADFRLTAFDRWHLVSGVRWSQYRRDSSSVTICNTNSGACAGRVGSWRSPPVLYTYSAHDVSWPPTVSLIYDVNPSLSTYVGYTDIYQSQANYVDLDLKPLEPILGSNVELGAKWQAPDGRLNASLAGYRIEKKHFAVEVEDGPYLGPNGTYPVCCYSIDPSNTQLSQGIDAELAGEVRPGWQVSTGYTWNKNEYKGRSNGSSEGQPFASIQPKHLLKVWTSRAFRSGGWLNDLTVAGGVIAQTKAYRAGSACVEFNPPNPTTGAVTCLRSAPYQYTQKAYAILSARVDYRINSVWNVALNSDNLTDVRYYQTPGGSTSGNWYGAPRSYRLSLRGQF